MHIDISARNTQLTEALEEDVRKRFKRLERQTKGEGRAHVILTVDGHIHKAEAIVSDLGGKPLTASVEGDNMYTSINKLAQTLTQSWSKQRKAKLASRTEETIRRPALG
jgi:ribosomal subunit interface protein